MPVKWSNITQMTSDLYETMRNHASRWFSSIERSVTNIMRYLEAKSLQYDCIHFSIKKTLNDHYIWWNRNQIYHFPSDHPFFSQSLGPIESKISKLLRNRKNI